MTFLMLSYITNDIGICYSQKMASNVLPPASWAWYCTFSDLLMHICTYHKKRDSAHIHKIQPEWIKENFRELERLLFYHQCLKFAKKKKKKNHLMDILPLVFILFHLFKIKSLKPCSFCSYVIHFIYLFDWY